MNVKEFKKFAAEEIARVKGSQDLKDRRYSDKVKLEAVRLMLTKKSSASELALMLGLANSSVVSKWKKVPDFIPKELRDMTRKSEVEEPVATSGHPLEIFKQLVKQERKKLSIYAPKARRYSPKVKQLALDLRDQQKMTASELADILGINCETLNSWKKVKKADDPKPQKELVLETPEVEKDIVVKEKPQLMSIDKVVNSDTVLIRTVKGNEVMVPVKFAGDILRQLESI